MEITRVNIKKVKTYKPNLLAIASIELDNCLVIHDLALVQGKERRLVSFPTKKKEFIQLNSTKDGYNKNPGFLDIVHPRTKEFRDYVEETLFKIYDEEIDNKED